MDNNDGISEIYQLLSNILLADLNDMLMLTREQCGEENKKVYEDLLKSLLKINNQRELESFYTNMVAINKIEKFDEKFYSSLSTAYGILERVVANTLATAKKCVQNFEYIIKKNTKQNVETTPFYEFKQTEITKSNVSNKPMTKTSPTAQNMNETISNMPILNSQTTAKIDEMMGNLKRSSKGSFDCHLCPYKTFNSRLTLRAHFENHFPREKVPTVKCKYCDYYLLSEHSIAKHEQLHVQNSASAQKSTKYYDCDLCPYKSIIFQDLLRHKKNHEYRENALKCRFCDYYLFANINKHECLHKEYSMINSDSSYNSSKSNKNDASLFFCTRCPFETNSDDNLTGHMKYHEYRNGCLKCRYCDYYSIKNNLRNHEIVHPEYVPDQEEEIEVSDVATVYENLDLIENRKRKRASSPSQDLIVKTSYTNKCQMCPFQTEFKTDFQSHLKNHQYRVGAIKCRYCDYYLISGIRKHEVIHPECERNDNDDTGGEIQCNICPFRTRIKQTLAKHVKNHELTSGNFKCRYCNFFSTYEYNMTNHEMLHSDYQPKEKATPRPSLGGKKSDAIKFSCQLCPFKTADMRSVKVHMERHTTLSGALKCSHCDYYVNQRYLIVKHEILHGVMAKEKEETKCELCPYKTNDKKCLRLHAERHVYSEGVAKCRFCPFYNMKAFNLLKHEKLHPEFTPKTNYENNFNDESESKRLREDKNKNVEIEEEKSYGCTMCPYVSNDAEKVKIHTQRHDPTKFPDRALKCKICSYRSMSPTVLRKHQKLHFNVKPVVVIKQEAYIANESSPFKSTHSHLFNQLSDSDKKIHPENVKTANENEYKIEHNSNSSKVRAQSPDTLKCSLCHYKPSNAEFLERHMQRHVFKENTNKCKFCPYYTSNLKNMKRHEDKHETLKRDSNKPRAILSESDSENPRQKRCKLNLINDNEVDAALDSENSENAEIIKDCLNEIIDGVEKNA